MKREIAKHSLRLLLHALFFVCAVLIGIYQIFQFGIEGVVANTAKGSVLQFVGVYLALVAIEALVEERVFNSRSYAQATLSATLALAAGLVAFILFLFIGYSLGEATGNRILDSLIALVLFLALEWPLRWGLDRLTRRMRHG